MNLILPFTTAELPHLDQVGGKALSLIRMMHENLPVPPGVVMTAAFFEPWLAAVQTSEAWGAAQAAGWEDLAPAAQALQSLCQDLQFTPAQREELQRALETLPGGLFAVRSSSPQEDLDSASFAGGYETTLGVSVEKIEAAVRRCFASSFDQRVFAYKRERGFPTDQARIAVIIQQQIDAESAGVAFSLNPLNNCYDEALINANDGLGETVVAGEVDPDVFVVDRLAHQIIESKIGAKGAVTRLNPEGGTVHSTRAPAAAACLSPAQVHQIARLIDQVEALCQKPIDIEWAFAQDRLYLLQVRPITTYLPLPEEMLTAPGAPKRLYANSTLIEQGLQEPLSVLGTDFLGYVLKQVGGPIGADAIGPDGLTFTAAGGYYMNISYALKLGMRNIALAPGSIGDPRVTATLDSIDMTQYLSGDLPKKLKAVRAKMMFKMLPLMKSTLLAYLRPEHVLRKYQAALPQNAQRFDTVSADGLSLQGQAAEMTELLRFFYAEYGIPMVLAAQFAQQRIRALFKQEISQVRDHLVNLGVALPGNKTTEMGELMYSLASSDEISRHESAPGFVADLAGSRMSPEFIRLWAHFIAEFGARCPGEIDVATPRPKEQPALIFEQLKNMSQTIRARSSPQSFFMEARAKREAAYHALVAVALKKGKPKARSLEKYYQVWVSFGGFRETGKHYVVKVVDLFRRRALKICQAFVTAGRLDRIEQIFDLTIADIDRALTDPALDLRALARERTLLTNKIKQSHLVARIIDSRGKIYFPPRVASAHGELSGVPISPGLVQGRVKVFKHAAEKKLLPGEILVARATDPGWTPLFINARGIILEIGGALQHGAVVAREYGIPCVSGLDGATDLLKDGQLVEVDGSNGIVRILGEKLDY